ncbi:hypothetical protein GCM10025868_32050 [Angustibacter aerolatus]|uniref:Uncharacterized protein n=1 Tax=Angustibacter aerolatus TaxID=1162965 RepID=A0ABQ6JMG2_9ACTN|nr:hypothetical protein GCM10025868_32050 [Angustibacter aerolatus]
MRSAQARSTACCAITPLGTNAAAGLPSSPATSVSSAARLAARPVPVPAVRDLGVDGVRERPQAVGQPHRRRAHHEAGGGCAGAVDALRVDGHDDALAERPTASRHDRLRPSRSTECW